MLSFLYIEFSIPQTNRNAIIRIRYMKLDSIYQLTWGWCRTHDSTARVRNVVDKLEITKGFMAGIVVKA